MRFKIITSEKSPKLEMEIKNQIIEISKISEDMIKIKNKSETHDIVLVHLKNNEFDIVLIEKE